MLTNRIKDEGYVPMPSRRYHCRTTGPFLSLLPLQHRPKVETSTELLADMEQTLLGLTASACALNVDPIETFLISKYAEMGECNKGKLIDYGAFGDFIFSWARPRRLQACRHTNTDSPSLVCYYGTSEISRFICLWRPDL